MISSLIPIVLLILAAVSLAAFLRKPFSELMAPVLFAVIFTLYSFYIFDKLPLGTTFVTIGLLLLTASCAGSMLIHREGRRRLIQTVRSKTFLLFLAATAAFILFSVGKIVNLWDSLRLWGAYPKVLHTTGELQLGSRSVLYPSMQSYPPGMPLFCYYITSFSPTFPESSLYICYSLFGFAMLLPLLEGADRLGPRARYAVFIGILFVPWLISSVNDDYAQYYSCLFIDIPLGLCAGYTFFLLLRGRKNGVFDLLKICLACACLALLKDSGSFISLCCILAHTADCLMRKNSIPPFKRLLFILMPAVFLCYTWSSWDHLRNVWDVSNHLHLDLALPSLGEFVRIVYRFLVTPAFSFLTPFGSIGISLPAALLSIFTLKLLLCRYTQHALFRLELVDIGSQVLCYAGFFIGYCLIFINNIRTGEYPSYSRYMNTILISALYIFSTDCIFRYNKVFHRIWEKIHAYSVKDTDIGALTRCVLKLGKFALVASLIMFVTMTLVNREHAGGALYVSARKTADAVCASVPAFEDGEYTDVYLVIPGEDENNYRLHHRIYFELIDDGIRVKNYFDERDITVPELGYDADSFMDHLIREGYDYVVLVWSSDQLDAQFGSLFQAGGTNTVYKVSPEDCSLVPIGQPKA